MSQRLGINDALAEPARSAVSTPSQLLMTYYSRSLVAFLATLGVALAQSNQGNNSQNGQKITLTGNPDTDWSHVSQQAQPASVHPSNDGRPVTPQTLTQVKQQADNARIVAQGAKDFYTQYPSH